MQMKKMNEVSMRKISSSDSSSKQWVDEQITIDLALDEAQLLEQYCSQTGKATQDVIQELIQRLPMMELHEG
jgi:hypothetical protein